MSFSDHFSTQATDYAKYRPGYPPALFEWLASLTPQHELAWDVGTGSGQAAVQLARYFERVIATDPSSEQIRNAQPHARVSYRVQPAEACDLDDASVDLIVVAQALHWFDFQAFYAQARRVLKPQGVIAAWTYGLHEIAPDVDAIVLRFYNEIVGPYWPPERRYIEERYQTIPFPFVEYSAPPMRLELRWSLHDLIGYLGTWSATQRYIKDKGHDPRELIYESLQSVWGASKERIVSWPLYFRIGGLRAMSGPMLA